MTTEKAVDQTKRTAFNLDFEPDSPQLTQTLRSLQKKQMLEARQRNSPIETNSRRALFNEDSNSFVGFPSESQEFQTLPISSELVPKDGRPNSPFVVSVSSESAITLSSDTYDTSVDKSPAESVPRVSSRKSMRSAVLRRTKYTPICMDLSDRKSLPSRSRSVNGRKSSVGMVLATPAAKPSGNIISDNEDNVAESNITLDDSSIFIAETQILPTLNKPRPSVNKRKSAMVLETPAKRSKTYVPPVPVTPTTIMDITNRVGNVADSHMDLTLDESSMLTVETQILPADSRNKSITPSRNIQEIAVVPSFDPSSSSVVVTKNAASDTISGKRRRTLFTPNKLIELNRSNVTESRGQLLDDSPKASESTKSKF